MTFQKESKLLQEHSRLFVERRYVGNYIKLQKLGKQDRFHYVIRFMQSICDKNNIQPHLHI